MSPVPGLPRESSTDKEAPPPPRSSGGDTEPCPGGVFVGLGAQPCPGETPSVLITGIPCLPPPQAAFQWGASVAFPWIRLIQEESQGGAEQRVLCPGLPGLVVPDLDHCHPASSTEGAISWVTHSRNEGWR